MEPHASPLHPVLRLLDASFRLGKAFGTEVRVYGAALILVLLVGPSLDLLKELSWADGLIYLALLTLALYGSVWLHEMAHVAAGWRWHLRTPLITLSPLGGLAHMQAPAPSPGAEVVIAAAGPGMSLLIVALAYPLSKLVGASPFAWAAGGKGLETWRLTLEPVPFLLSTLVEINLAVGLFNLLPLYPLDGGRILRAGLAYRMHPNRATLWAARVGLTGAVVGGLAALLFVRGLPGGLLLAVAITNAFACQRALLEARYGDGPYGPRREAWESDAEAWKLGAPQAEEEEAVPATRPSRRRNERRGHPDVPTGAELDHLLDRVRDVGLAGLSDSERAALQRASDARRADR